MEHRIDGGQHGAAVWPAPTPHMVGLRSVIEAAPTPAVMINRRGRILHANRRALDLVGLSAEEMAERSMNDIVHPDDHLRHRTTVERMWSLAGTQMSLRFLLRDARGRSVPAIISGTAIDGDGGRQALLYLQDLRAPLAVEAEVERLSRTDPTTGVMNRAAIVDRLGLAMAGSPGGGVAAIVVDVDRFKVVNDRLGHDVGDTVLAITAERIADIVGSERVGRVGADEFLAIHPVVDDDEEALVVARRIIEAVAAPILVGTTTIHVTCTAGVAVDEDEQVSPDTIMRRAVIALHRARADGRSNVLADEASHLELVRQLEVEAEVSEIVRTGRLDVAFQPITSPRLGIVGVEALLRPVGSDIPPGELVAVAERTSLILDIGALVTEKALAAMPALNQAAGRRLVLSINLSARQLHDPDTAGMVLDAVARHAHPPAELCVELTETAAMARPEATMVTLGTLRDAGVKLSMDDFGIGYSSFSYLRDLPVHEVKVDMSFLHRAAMDEGALKVMRGMISLCTGMGLETVCEGVEHEGHRRIAVDAGCSRWQGYLGSRPLPVEELTAVLRAEFKGSTATRSPATNEGSSEPREAVTALMHELDMVDLLVLQRVGSHRFAQIGGLGQGRRWAGIVDVAEDEIRNLGNRLTADTIVSGTSPTAEQVVGPYYAMSWAMRVDDELLVVVGNQSRPVALDPNDPRVVTLLDLGSSMVTLQSAAKPLADEVERLQALHTLLAFAARDTDEALQHVLDTTVHALGCDLGVAVLPGAVMATSGSSAAPLDRTALARVGEALHLMTDESPRYVQRAEPDDLPLGLVGLLGLSAWGVLPLQRGGVMIIAHTRHSARPRGFTTLCQRLGLGLSQASHVIIDAAGARAAVAAARTRAAAAAVPPG